MIRTATRTAAAGRHRRQVLRAAGMVAAVAALTACGRLAELPADPPVTPQEWCQQRPCLEWAGTTVNEPLGSALVFLLALLWVGVGWYFLASRRGQRSRGWFGLALVVGGIGAALAGISYQLFSYELKCAGQEVCLLTNGFEVWYSICQAASISAMIAAVAYAAALGRARTLLLLYAALNLAGYLVVAALGSFLPDAALLSFEVLTLFSVPGIIVVVVLGLRGIRRDGGRKYRDLLWAAVLLVLVQVAYFAYYAAGVTAALWDGGNGVYFSENDVLHIGMIGWLLFVARTLGRSLADSSPTEESAGHAVAGPAA